MNRKKIQIIKNMNTERGYNWNILSMLMSMGDYAKLCPDHFRKEFLEWNLLKFGYCAIGENNGKYYVGYISGYEFDEYGLPIGHCNFHTRNGYEFNGEIGKNIVVGYNNNIRTPETNIVKFGELFTEIDKSIMNSVTKSRLHPIPIAKDDKMKKAIDELLKDIDSGYTKSILSEFSLKDFANSANGNPSDDPLKTVSLTEPDQISRVQYLSNLRDDLLKRICNFYGHSLAGVNKMAQVNSDEIKGYETYSMIYPLIMRQARIEFMDECNKVFGTDWKYEFSEPWKHLLANENITSNDEIIEKGDGENEEIERFSDGESTDSE